MNQGRRDDQERSAYVFCGICFLVLVGMVSIGMISHEGRMFPWMNLAGLVGLGLTLKTAGKLA